MKMLMIPEPLAGALIRHLMRDPAVQLFLEMDKLRPVDMPAATPPPLSEKGDGRGSP